MSFSANIKKELSEINNLAKKEEVRYELIGFLSSNNIENNGKIMRFSTESEYNINRFAKLLKNMYIENFKIEIQGKVFSITTKITNYEIENFEEICEENFKAFIRGIYMGSGSMNNPNKMYHLEVKIPNNKLVTKVVNELAKYNVNVKCIDKSIYIKDSEEISKFLAFIGASKSVLEFEQIRVQREMNNKVNRLVNCKSANLNKTINASVEQINAIKKLKENGEYNKIDNALKELAELRLEFPDKSLVELGNMLIKPIGKSGVNYRMKKIIELSKKF